MGPSAEHDPRRRWLGVLAKCLGLLAIPFAVWALLPSFGPPKVAPSARPAAPAATGDPALAPRAARPKVTAAPSAGALAVSGQVVSPDGKPVAGAAVTCPVGGHDLEATTDEQGRFRLPIEGVGCRASASKKGFSPSDEVELTAQGQNRLELVPASSLAGDVVDQDGSAIMSYRVGLELASADGGAASRPVEALRVDEVSGAFAFEDLPPGRYTVVVGATHFPVSRTEDVEVRPGQAVTGLRIVMKPGANVSGRVVDGVSGEPVGGAILHIEGNSVSNVGSNVGVTGPDGRFTIEGVPAEPFDLRATILGRSTGSLHDLHVAPGGPPLEVTLKVYRFGKEPKEAEAEPTPP